MFIKNQRPIRCCYFQQVIAWIAWHVMQIKKFAPSSKYFISKACYAQHNLPCKRATHETNIYKTYLINKLHKTAGILNY